MKNTAKLYLELIRVALPAMVKVVKENPQALASAMQEIQELVSDPDIKVLIHKIETDVEVLEDTIADIIEEAAMQGAVEEHEARSTVDEFSCIPF